MALQGFGGPPAYLRTAPADYYCAALACQAVLAALFARERTGRGQKVETSLLNAVLALQSGLVVDFPGRQSVLRETPTYRLYRAGDGQWLFLACGNQSFWVKLCKAIGRPELADDPRFSSWLSRRDHGDALTPLLEAARVAPVRRRLARGHDGGADTDPQDFMRDPAVTPRMVVAMKDREALTHGPALRFRPPAADAGRPSRRAHGRRPARARRRRGPATAPRVAGAPAAAWHSHRRRDDGLRGRVDTADGVTR